MNGRVSGPCGDFDDWYLQARPPLERALWVMCGDHGLAQDLCDEAFMRAFAHWNRVEQMRSPGGWVHTVALNLLKRQRRRAELEQRLLRRHRPVATPPPEVHPELWAAVARLPDRQREAVVLRYVAELTEADVAEAMGITEGAASATLVRARRRLGELLPGETMKEAP